MNKTEYTKMFELEENHYWFISKRQFIDAYLSKLPKTKLKILDVGSGTGGTTCHLEKFGKTIGLEPNDLAISLCKKRGLRVIKGEAEKLPFKKGGFELVTIFDVLYHKNIRNVTKAINEAGRVLNNNGYLLITDSAFSFIKGGHDIDLGGKRRFTLSDLRKLLIKSGFSVVNQTYMYFLTFPFVIFKRLIINKVFRDNDKSDVKPISPIINNLLINVLKLESKIIKYAFLPWGSSLMILAKKTNTIKNIHD